MGNDSSKIDTRAKKHFGYIYVKTAMPFYIAGDLVEGKVYIRAEETIPVKKLELNVKGKEKISYWYDHTVYEEDGDGNRRSRTERRKYKAERTIINKSIHLSLPEELPPGDYIVPFQIQLPNDLPSSIMWSRKDHYDKPKAKIKYEIEAELDISGYKDMKYEQMLIIHEKPRPFV